VRLCIRRTDVQNARSSKQLRLYSEDAAASMAAVSVSVLRQLIRIYWHLTPEQLPDRYSFRHVFMSRVPGSRHSNPAGRENPVAQTRPEEIGLPILLLPG
jgi:hypothetical protein